MPFVKIQVIFQFKLDLEPRPTATYIPSHKVLLTFSPKMALTQPYETAGSGSCFVWS